MTYTKKVAYNTAAQMVGRVILVGISLVTVGVLTRQLGVGNFGRYTTVLAYIGFFGIFADLGFFYILVRELSIDPKNSQKITSNVLGIRACGAFLFYGLGILIALAIPSYDQLTKYAIMIGALGFFWQTLQNTITAVFQVNYRMDKAVISDIVSRAITLAVVLWFFYLGKGLIFVMLAYLIGSLANFLMAYWLAQKYVKISFAFDLKMWKNLMVKALPMGIAIILHFVYFRVDALMLSWMKGPEHVGIYGPSYKILEVMLMMPAIFISSVLPVYSRYIAKHDDRLKTAVQKSFDFLAIATVPMVVGIFILATPIVRLIAGDEYLHTGFVYFGGILANSAVTLKILIFAALASALAQSFSQLLVAGGYQKKLILPSVLFVLVNIVLNVIFIPKYSYVAAAFTTIVTETLVLITIVWLAKRTFNTLPHITRFLKALFSSLVMALAINHLIDSNVFIAVAIGALVYLSVMWLIRGIGKEMLVQFKN
ncbi:MAG: Heteropolysaccharide repeat-containing protein [Candidatus Berkelbacteria bacterium Licking1014_7]|uniref:Heteropolysaccharide repeat-containing protein n=1 Tax=Candidatus Berkelbacteria bacterium Licking1014_7 TaxID=2017147 RepID=A0A554LKR7_9BACT|nr:MAG: Heteropolysaccharide repeat-containing protein [Candidatus Berkelbacteria bacterium Licking1014_7]